MIALASSVDKVGVIPSEHSAYAFTGAVSLDVSTTQSKWNNNNKSSKNHKGAFLCIPL
jgi:hypothetical protein